MRDPPQSEKVKIKVARGVSNTEIFYWPPGAVAESHEIRAFSSRYCTPLLVISSSSASFWDSKSQFPLPWPHFSYRQEAQLIQRKILCCLSHQIAHLQAKSRKILGRIRFAIQIDCCFVCFTYDYKRAGTNTSMQLTFLWPIIQTLQNSQSTNVNEILNACFKSHKITGNNTCIMGTGTYRQRLTRRL